MEGHHDQEQGELKPLLRSGYHSRGSIATTVEGTDSEDSYSANSHDDIENNSMSYSSPSSSIASSSVTKAVKERNQKGGRGGGKKNKLCLLIAIVGFLLFFLWNKHRIYNHHNTTVSVQDGTTGDGEKQHNEKITVDDDDDRIDYDTDPNYEVAYVNIMRHGEKDSTSGDHLSQIGYARANYYAKCMMTTETDTDTTTTEALPKPVGALLAQLNATIVPSYKGNVGLSQRSYETLVPLSAKIGLPVLTPCKMTDYTCFATEVLEKLIRVDTTVVVAWEHKLFPKLLRLLLVDHPSSSTGTESTSTLSGTTTPPPIPSIYATREGKEDIETHFKTWPDTCDAQSWKDPRVIKPEKDKKGRAFIYHNACFDLVWQIKYVKERKTTTMTMTATTGTSNNNWIPVQVKQINNGYGGAGIASPCAEGLAPMKAP